MEKEIWKDIKNYEGLYQVSNLGRVKSLKFGKEKILKAFIGPFGYLIVSLSKNGKLHTYNVHRLVAEAFIPNPLGLSDVNHISEDKTDCSTTNLEWMSHKDNCNYGTRNKKISEGNSKAVYCVELNKTFKNSVEAARELGLYDSANLCRCLKGKRKTCKKYHWEYVK